MWLISKLRRKPKPGRRKLRSRRRRAVRVVVGLLILLAVLAALYETLTWPDVASLVTEKPESTSLMDRRRAAGTAVEWSWTPYDRISPLLKRAVIVAEDIDFFSHHGFAGSEIRQAIEDRVREGKRLRGASTIPQQLAKNLWLSQRRSLLRKFKEAALTVQLERSLSKRRILELYLNVVEYGPGVFGAEAAARHYFGKSAAALSFEEAAALASSLPSSTWFPGCDSKRYRAHKERVSRRMEQATWIDREF